MKYPILVVYKHTTDNGAELKHALRTFKNISNWNGQLFVAGDAEDWFTGIIHIPIEHLANSYLDQEVAIMAAIADERLSDDFILTNDDIYITKLLDITYLHQGELPDSGVGYHKRQKAATRAYLKQQGMTTIDYELHTPMIFNKDKYKAIHDIVVNEMPLKPRSLYGNIYQVGGEFYEDKKTRTSQLPSGSIISTLRYTQELENKWPEPSRFEK